MRDTIFISHATPEDNEFVSWLSSRLQLAGYKVWCDLDGLIGGENFWPTIDAQIRNHSIKFLLVVSNFICYEPGKLRDGIDKEFSLGESISKKSKLNDYIIPLLIDQDTPYDYFIGSNRYNHIPFNENWAFGLRKLISKLEKDNVPKQAIGDNKSIVSWYENEFSTKVGLFAKRERYYSNLWPIHNIPAYMYLYQYSNNESAEAVYQEDFEFPVIKSGNILVTFADEINTVCTKSENIEISPVKTYTIKTTDILRGVSGEDFPTLNNTQNLLKWLLNRSFHLLMRKRGLHWYAMANRSLAYYFEKSKLNNDKVTFKYPNRKKTKTKNLVGKYKIDNKKTGNWHFAVSSRSSLYPLLGFSLNSHILFSDDGYNIWSDKKKMHSARRRKGRSWFNEAWRDQLIAFINAIRNEDGEIAISLNKDFILRMPLLTEMFFSEFGYDEPKSGERQNIVNVKSSHVDEEEFYEEIEV